jgi:hypothetical protein
VHADDLNPVMVRDLDISWRDARGLMMVRLRDDRWFVSHSSALDLIVARSKALFISALRIVAGIFGVPRQVGAEF